MLLRISSKTPSNSNRTVLAPSSPKSITVAERLSENIILSLRIAFRAGLTKTSQSVRLRRLCKRNSTLAPVCLCPNILAGNTLVLLITSTSPHFK